MTDAPRICYRCHKRVTGMCLSATCVKHRIGARSTLQRKRRNPAYLQAERVRNRNRMRRVRAAKRKAG